ncbi:phage head closure protein [Burkholderia plantarii]|uniref:phage head closure protein n=1 Tax=Burkholderia plantarii TaxID=41899 RepID=UPI0034E29579|nr:phage head closure protein [Burkholderia plantarii]
MALRIGNFNRRVSLQEPQVTRDSAGQEIPTWVEIGRPWVDIRSLSGREYATSGTVVSGATVSIRFRYRTDLTSRMRVVQGETIYNMLAVLPDERGREYVDVPCNTGVNDG